MQTIVWVSAHAAQNGSHCSSCSDAKPSAYGFIENVTAWHPLAATRRISAAASTGSHIIGSEQPMNRSG